MNILIKWIWSEAKSVESLASLMSSLKSMIISSTSQFPCHSNANLCMAESTGFTALKASCNFIMKSLKFGSVILLLLVMECINCSFHFCASVLESANIPAANIVMPKPLPLPASSLSPVTTTEPDIQATNCIFDLAGKSISMKWVLDYQMECQSGTGTKYEHSMKVNSTFALWKVLDTVTNPEKKILPNEATLPAHCPGTQSQSEEVWAEENTSNLMGDWPKKYRKHWLLYRPWLCH